MSHYDDDDWDYDPCCDECGLYPCDCDYEEIERVAYEKEKTYLVGLSNEDLGKQWRHHCNRHDRSVDNCEAMNNSTIEDAQGWMTFIEKEFERRGVDRFKYTLGEEA